MSSNKEAKELEGYNDTLVQNTLLDLAKLYTSLSNGIKSGEENIALLHFIIEHTIETKDISILEDFWNKRKAMKAKKA